MKHYGLVCLNVGGCEFIGFRVQQKEDMSLIHVWAIYGAANFPSGTCSERLWLHLNFDMVCLSTVGNAAWIISSVVKALYTKAKPP